MHISPNEARIRKWSVLRYVARKRGLGEVTSFVNGCRLFYASLLASIFFFFSTVIISRFFFAASVPFTEQSVATFTRDVQAPACENSRAFSVNSSAKSTPFSLFPFFSISRRFRKQYARVEQTPISKWLLDKRGQVSGSAISRPLWTRQIVNRVPRGFSSHVDRLELCSVCNFNGNALLIIRSETFFLYFSYLAHF